MLILSENKKVAPASQTIKNRLYGRPIGGGRGRAGSNKKMCKPVCTFFCCFPLSLASAPQAGSERPLYNVIFQFEKVFIVYEGFYICAC